eukprot:1605771-Rhodomonas_salina.1
MLSQSGKAASDGGSQRSSGSKRLHNESRASQERDKVGGPRKRVPYSDLQDCGKCGGKHPGADKGECRMFDCISAILDKKGVAGSPGAHKAMAAELMRLDKEDRNCDFDKELGNE